MKESKEEILNKINEIKISITRDEKLLMEMNDPHFELLESKIREERNHLSHLVNDLNSTDYND